MWVCMRVWGRCNGWTDAYVIVQPGARPSWRSLQAGQIMGKRSSSWPSGTSWLPAQAEQVGEGGLGRRRNSEITAIPPNPKGRRTTHIGQFIQHPPHREPNQHLFLGWTALASPIPTFAPKLVAPSPGRGVAERTTNSQQWTPIGLRMAKNLALRVLNLLPFHSLASAQAGCPQHCRSKQLGPRAARPRRCVVLRACSWRAARAPSVAIHSLTTEAAANQVAFDERRFGCSGASALARGDASIVCATQRFWSAKTPSPRWGWPVSRSGVVSHGATCLGTTSRHCLPQNAKACSIKCNLFRRRLSSRSWFSLKRRVLNRVVQLTEPN